MTRCDRCNALNQDTQYCEAPWRTLRLEGPEGLVVKVELCQDCAAIIAEIDPARVLECLRRLYR